MTHCKTGRAVQVSVVAKQRQAMLDRLSTPEGKRLYALRQQIAEPTFGNIKSNMKLSRFLLDGKAGASSETWLMCMAHNLKIYARRAANAAASFSQTESGHGPATSAIRRVLGDLGSVAALSSATAS